MQVRRLIINNFRGIQSLDWRVPGGQKLITLIGPGDSGKSTTLEALDYALSDRWSIPFSDTDFYRGNSEQSILIQAVLVDLPAALLKESAFGLSLSGIDSEGTLYQDPTDELDPALIVCLRVDASLEPKWSVERVDGESQMLTSSQRRSFSTFKVDDRNDAQLRWTRTSALGRMSAADGGEREALAAASRAARDALADNENLSLAELATKVQERANKIGGGTFASVRPGLDTSRSSMGAGLALYEDVIPLTSFGLGSRRLASLAVQQLGAGARSIAVIDELESGLEPHRAVRLLNYLISDDDYSQVFVTTHSPVLVEQAPIESLATVQEHNGIVTITSLSGASEEMQRLRRSRPSSLLARRVVVVEGKTEHGVLLECIDEWDDGRIAGGWSNSAGEGVAIQDAMGGSEVAPRTMALASIGISVAGFMDNDDRSVDAAVESARQAGIDIITWDEGSSIEQQVCGELSAQGLNLLLELAAEIRVGSDTVLADINADSTDVVLGTLHVEDWISGGLTLEDARGRVAKAAMGKKWFKDVEAGRKLGAFMLNMDSPAIEQRLAQLFEFIYPDPEEESVPADQQTDG